MLRAAQGEGSKAKIQRRIGGTRAANPWGSGSSLLIGQVSNMIGGKRLVTKKGVKSMFNIDRFGAVALSFFGARLQNLLRHYKKKSQKKHVKRQSRPQ